MYNLSMLMGQVYPIPLSYSDPLGFGFFDLFYMFVVGENKVG